MEKGTKLKAGNFEKSQHFTQPPAHFTEASLVKTLEELGIGRPSTYAPTISTIINRHYVAKEQKNLYITELGEVVNSIMKKSFASIVDVNFTANMVVKYGPHGKFLACPGFPECRNTKPYLEKTGIPCPKCGGEIVIRKNKKGRRYYGCLSYPECEFMSWQKPSTEHCPECGGPMVEKGNKLACMDKQCGFSKSMPKKTEE